VFLKPIVITSQAVNTINVVQGSRYVADAASAKLHKMLNGHFRSLNIVNGYVTDPVGKADRPLYEYERYR
jgi:hypothetical protein